ncbi:MAG: lactonase family protein [Clostridia bacterium]|nr:lactonase family protein [Clostridia bacterium]
MDQTFDIYVASCTKTGGIYRYRVSGKKVTLIDSVKLDRPMYLARHKDKMYALLREAYENGDSGVITYDIADDGSLADPRELGSTQGKCGCHLTVNDDGVYAVNYLSGSVVKVSEKLVVHSGRGPHPIRQDGPHTHFVCSSPDNKYILVTDLGLDRIFVYDKNLNDVSYADVPAGHGARHLIFSDDGKILYCANELESTVSVFSYNNGVLELKNTVRALPEDYDGENTAAAIRFKDGMLYVSNRGHDSISCFAINGFDLKLKSIVPCGGKHPRDFNIFGDLLVCTNMHSNDVTFFRITGTTLEKLDFKLYVDEPLCVI